MTRQNIRSRHCQNRWKKKSISRSKESEQIQPQVADKHTEASKPIHPQEADNNVYENEENLPRRPTTENESTVLTIKVD
jgi:hypothetical protein